MKFKIKKGTPLFNKIDAVGKKIRACNRAALDLSEKTGFKQFRPAMNYMAGGISAFHSEKKPDGYMLAYGNKYPDAIFPKKIKANKELLESIDALPKVEYNELNKLIKYDGFNSKEGNGTGGLRISFHPGITFGKSNILIDVPEYVNYKPVKDMVEITTTEYNKLKK